MTETGELDGLAHDLSRANLSAFSSTTKDLGNDYLAPEFGYLIHKNCFKVTNLAPADLMAPIFEAAKGGLSCLHRLNTESSRKTYDRLLALLTSTTRPKLECTDKKFAEQSGYESVPTFEGMKEATVFAISSTSPRSEGHPIIRVQAKSLEQLSPTGQLPGILFHEMLHNTELSHPQILIHPDGLVDQDAERVYQCQFCCFPKSVKDLDTSKPAVQEFVASACRVCSNSYPKGMRDKEYLLDHLDFLFKAKRNHLVIPELHSKIPAFVLAELLKTPASQEMDLLFYNSTALQLELWPLHLAWVKAIKGKPHQLLEEKDGEGPVMVSMRESSAIIVDAIERIRKTSSNVTEAERENLYDSAMALILEPRLPKLDSVPKDYQAFLSAAISGHNQLRKICAAQIFAHFVKLSKEAEKNGQIQAEYKYLKKVQKLLPLVE